MSQNIPFLRAMSAHNSSDLQFSVSSQLAVAVAEARMSDEAYQIRDTLRSEDAACVAAMDKWPIH